MFPPSLSNYRGASPHPDCLPVLPTHMLLKEMNCSPFEKNLSFRADPTGSVSTSTNTKRLNLTDRIRTGFDWSSCHWVPLKL